VKVTVSVEGEPFEVADGLLRLGSALRSAFADGEADVTLGSEFDQALMSRVWNRITEKAKGALRAMLDHPNGVTKEEIVDIVSALSNTRDLGGALSSINRVCKGLKVPDYQMAIYYRQESSDGQVLYILSDVARGHIKSILDATR
jgi:hypothetical protein